MERGQYRLLGTGRIRDDEGEPEGTKVKPADGLKPPSPIHPQGKVKLMDGERIVFTEETNPQNYLKPVASGDVDETMLEALEDYVKRQKKRLKIFGVTPDHIKSRQGQCIVEAAMNVGPDADRLAAADKGEK
jgi:hypothetical protein